MSTMSPPAGSGEARQVFPPSTCHSSESLDAVLTRIRVEIRSAVKQSGLTMVRSRFDTSDIVQESLLQIWKQLARSGVDDLEFTRGLLSVVAKGHARKMLRFHNARKRSFNREQVAVGAAPARDRGPLQKVAIHEEIGLMLDALNYIHPVRQLIVFRRFFDDATYREIGEEICRPREWVRQQCLKAQREIRTLLRHRSKAVVRVAEHRTRRFGRLDECVIARSFRAAHRRLGSFLVSV